jgi:iron complex outermembrane receptor protein
MRLSKQARWRTFALATVLMIASISTSIADEARSFDVDAGQAVKTLKLFAKQSELGIVFDSRSVKDVRTESVVGLMIPSDALERMLGNTALVFDQDDETGAFAVTRVVIEEEGMSSASVSQANQSQIADSVKTTRNEKTEHKNTTPMNKKKQKIGGLLKGLLAFAVAGVPDTIAQEGEKVVTLSPFSVQSSNDQTYTPHQTSTGTIVAKDRDQIPFVTSIITDDMIEDMRIDNPADLSEMIAGVSKDSNPLISDEGGQRSLSYRVRGFVSEPLYNGFQTGGISHSVDSIGRVEVSKGANSVLYGQSSAGGVINMIPKSPRYEDHARVTVGVGSNSSTRFIFDVGGPVNVENTGKSAGFRFGGGWQEFDREQIFFQSETSNIYGAYNWKFNDKVSLELNGEYTKFSGVPSRTPAFVSTGSGPDRVVDPFNRLRNDRNFSYNGPHSHNEREAWMGSAYLTMELSESVTARLGGFYAKQDEDSLTFGDVYGLGTNESGNGRFSRSINNRNTTAYKFDILHTGNLGGMKVESLFGFEDHMENGRFNTVRTNNSDTPLIVSIPFSRKPIASDYPAPPAASLFTELRGDSLGETDWTNLRFTQFITGTENRATFMWGLAKGDGESRGSDYRTNSQSFVGGDDITHSLGASYIIFDGDSDSFVNRATVFANQSTSFLIQGGNAQNPSDFDGFTTIAELESFARSRTVNPLEPQTGEGLEVGTRLDFADSKLGLNLTYFDQTRQNIARSFFVRESRVAGVDSENVIASFQLASGEENAKGVEVAFDWRANKNFLLTGSAQFTDGKVVSNTNAPEEEGFGLIRSPENMFSFWGIYDFSEGSMSGFSFGLGASYNSGTRIRPQINDRWRISDDYTMARALLRYSFQSGDVEHQFNLNIDNLMDDEFTMEDNFLSEPRIYKLTYTVNW